jgi:hypothetical protein
LFALFFIPITFWGQSEYTLDGRVQVKNGRSFSYQLVFTIKGTELNGYSVTKLKNSAPTKASIKGRVNVTAKTISFEEYPFENRQDNAITCFINATLSFKLVNGNYVLKGDFKGRDHFRMYCGHGTITVNEPPVALYTFFGINSTANTNQKQQPAGKHISDSVTNNSKKNTINSQHPEKQPTPINQNHPHSQHLKDPHKKTHVLDSLRDNEKNKEYEITSGVMHQFHWQTDTCVLDIYDGGVIDGDKITVILNADEVLTKHTLTKQKHRMKLYLKGKVNTISIIAENLGKTPPNTANFILTDGKRHYKIKAFNDIGESAEIMLKKK